MTIIASSWGGLAAYLLLFFGGVTLVSVFHLWLGNRLFKHFSPRQKFSAWLLALLLPVGLPVAIYVVTLLLEAGPFDPEVWLVVAGINLGLCLIVRVVSAPRAK